MRTRQVGYGRDLRSWMERKLGPRKGGKDLDVFGTLYTSLPPRVRVRVSKVDDCDQMTCEFPRAFVVVSLDGFCTDHGGQEFEWTKGYVY
jgi:hypothetical protein